MCCPGEIVARCEWVVDHGAVDACGERRLQAALRVFHHQAFVRAGAQLAQREQVRARKFRGAYLRNPKVTVDVASFRPFYILGEVGKAGEYPFKSGLNVMSAMALAGGATYRASRSTVMIQHAGENGFKAYPMSPTIPVLPGDLIRVPERYF